MDPCVSITSPKGANAAAVRGVGCKLMVTMSFSLLSINTLISQRIFGLLQMVSSIKKIMRFFLASGQ